MKKLLALTMILAGLLIASQAIAQKDTKTGDTKQSTVKTTESQPAKSGAAGVKTETQAGTVTKSGSVSTKNSGNEMKQVTKPPQTGVESKQQQRPDAGKSSNGTTTSVKVTNQEAQKDPQTSGQHGMTSKIAVQGQQISDPTGRPSAYVDTDGTIRNPEGMIMGRYTEKGEYFSATGNKVGYVENGMIRTENGKEFARIGKDGRIYDAKGSYLGTIGPDGAVINNRGVRMGSAPGIDKNVAALVFFFPKQAPMHDPQRVKQQ